MPHCHARASTSERMYWCMSQPFLFRIPFHTFIHWQRLVADWLWFLSMSAFSCEPQHPLAIAAHTLTHTHSMYMYDTLAMCSAVCFISVRNLRTWFKIVHAIYHSQAKTTERTFDIDCLLTDKKRIERKKKTNRWRRRQMFGLPSLAWCTKNVIHWYI